MRGALIFMAIMGGMMAQGLAQAVNQPVLPGGGFAASHFELLWTKSPFALPSPTAAPTSPDYSLIGIAQLEGVSYASLIDKQSHERFLVTTRTPARGLTLISISHGIHTFDTSAIFEKAGQRLSLKVDEQSLMTAAANSVPEAQQPDSETSDNDPLSEAPRTRPRLLRLPPPPPVAHPPPQPSGDSQGDG